MPRSAFPASEIGPGYLIDINVISELRKGEARVLGELGGAAGLDLVEEQAGDRAGRHQARVGGQPRAVGKVAREAPASAIASPTVVAR